jgi:hypothetical protein
LWRGTERTSDDVAGDSSETAETEELSKGRGEFKKEGKEKREKRKAKEDVLERPPQASA